MKKNFASIAFVFFVCSLAAQEKYPVPTLTADQKHVRTLSQMWVMTAGGINFAKTHGVTPYEYGKYLGNLFAPSWGAGNDFDALVKGSLFNLENSRFASDPAIDVSENQDGSVSIIIDESIMHKFFPEGNPYASFSELAEFMKGINEPIAERMGATAQIDLRDNKMIYTYRMK